MKDIDELYCYKWYKDMYIRQGYSDDVASTKAKIDLNYQKSLYAMCEVFGVEEESNG